LGSENSKKRKRRTSFTPQALEILNEYFDKNSHPSADFNGNQGADMTMLAQKLNYDREVIRVWFCNKRQALKNSMKKMKTPDANGDISSDSDSMSQNTSSTTINAALNHHHHQQQALLTAQVVQQQQVIQQQQQHHGKFILK
jgi:hypothetical protein